MWWVIDHVSIWSWLTYILKLISLCSKSFPDLLWCRLQAETWLKPFHENWRSILTWHRLTYYLRNYCTCTLFDQLSYIYLAVLSDIVLFLGCRLPNEEFQIKYGLGCYWPRLVVVESFVHKVATKNLFSFDLSRQMRDYHCFGNTFRTFFR